MHEEEIEFVERPDGTSSIKVIRSKRPCHEVTKPFEEAKGVVVASKPEHNPGTGTGTGVKA